MTDTPKKNVMNRILSMIRNVAFVVVILFVCFIIYTMSQGNTVSIAGYRVLRVLTSSMEPTIVGNTCIITKEVDVDELKVGDIITFISEDPAIYGYYNTHRIHEIVEENGEEKFVTKGDNSYEVDPYTVSKDNVVGIYVKELPGGRLIGKAFVALSDNKVYFLVIIIPLVLCLMSYFWEIVGMVTGRYRDEEEDEEDEEEEGEEEGKEGDENNEDGDNVETEETKEIVQKKSKKKSVSEEPDSKKKKADSSEGTE